MRGLAAAALLLLTAAACLGPQQPPPGADAYTIYDLQNCANCHGASGEGTGLGPPLRDLGRWWDRAGLVDFLADPDRWEETDERLGRLAEEYSGNMQTYENLSEAERGRLADWLLEL